MLLNRKLWLGISGVLTVLLIVGGLNVFINGEAVMGTTDFVPWGSLLAAYVFFVATATGLSFVSALGHVFMFERFEVLGKRALLASIATLLMGFVVIALEVGNPFALFYILITPNFKSGIFWMIALYGLLLVLLIVEFFFTVIKERPKISFYLTIVVLIVELAAHSNLGAVFGNIIARPYWYGQFFPIFLIVLAIATGAALLAIMFYIISKVDKKDTFVYKGEHVVSSLGKILVVFTGIIAFFMIWRIITGLYGNVPGMADAMRIILTGPLAIPFWVFEVGFVIVVPLLILLLPNGLKPTRVLLASLFSMVGIFVMRIEMMFAGQMIPLEVVPNMLVETYRSISIYWSEWAIMIGAIGGSILIYLIGEMIWDLSQSGKGRKSKKKEPESVGKLKLELE